MRTRRASMVVVILAVVLALPAGGAARTAGPPRGDVNGDGTVDVGDVFHLINALFAGGPPAATPCAGDADASGSMEVGDVFFLINHLFAGGPAPSSPVATVTAPPGACMEAAGLVASVPAQAGAAYAWTVNGGTITAGEGTDEITWSAGAPGTATVACTVTVAECSAAGGASVTVDGPVIESLAADPGAVELGESSLVSFTIAEATGWTLGSSLGNSFSSQAGAGSGAFSIVYNSDNNSGTDTITLTASGACGSVQSTTTVQVCQDPDATVTAPASVCAGSTGNTASVPATAGASYDWSVTGGTITAGQGTPAVTWAAGTGASATPTVTVTSAAGCVSTGSANVVVNPVPSITAFTSSQDPVASEGEATLTGIFVNATSWTVSSSLGNSVDPPSGSGPGPATILFTRDIAIGDDTITFTVHGPCGSASTTLVVHWCPTGIAIAAPASACASSTGNAASVADFGALVTYAWGITNGSITGGAETRAITWSAGATGPVGLSCTVSTPSGCSRSATASVSLQPLPEPVGVTAEPAMIAAGGTSNLTFTCHGCTSVSITSNPSNGISAPTKTGASTWTALFSDSSGPGIYTINASGTNACGQSVAVTAVITSCFQLDLPITAPAAVCAGSSGSSASVPDRGAGVAYSWSIANGTITGGADTRSIVFSAGGSGSVQLTATASYSVTAAQVLQPGHCTEAGSATIPIASAPSVNSFTIAPGTINLGESATVSFTIADSNGWALGSSIGNSFTPASGVGSGTFCVVYDADAYSGLDTITLTVTNGCGSVQQTVPIQVEAGNEITIFLGPGNTVPMVLVKIPAGTFQMGAPAGERGSFDWEKPQHQVTLTRAYYLGKTEVTQGQWAAVMGTSMPSECGSAGVGDSYPVYCVSWDTVCGGTTGSSCTAGSFIGKVNTLLGSTEYRLPTEAEWERGARGGTTTELSFPVPVSWDTGCGSFPEATAYMWWCGNNTPYGPKPVGTKQANPYGLLDMHGNVWEWVGDWWSSYTAGAATDPPGPPTGSTRVIRGGSWFSEAQQCRSAHRYNHFPDGIGGDLGFRLARSL